MSLFISQKDDRTDLQKKLAQELQDKARQKAKIESNYDGVEDSSYIENTKKTTSLAWVWVLIFIAIVAIVIRLIIISVAK